MPADVVVTGLGVISPLGIGCEATWSALLADGRAVRRLAGGSAPDSTPPCGAPIDGFEAPPGTGHLARTTQLAVAAADEALSMAGLREDRQTRARTQVSVGTSKPLVELLAAGLKAASDRGRFGIPLPCTLFDVLPDAPARAVWMHFGLGGFHASVSACATGAHAIIHGAEMIRQGDADVVLAGSADSSMSPLWLAAYQRMGVLASGHPQRGPAWACRPFDRDRAGFGVGEGAAMLVLESADSADRRGGRALARLAGWATGSDPAGLTQLTESDSPLADVIRAALNDAAISPSGIRCVYAHGTGTPQNDRTELDALRQVFGGHLATLPVVSVKGAIGHLMGAAGAVETALAVLALRDTRSPGTVTLIDPDPQFRDACLPTSSFSFPAGPILKTSLGFGGHLAAIVVA